MNEETKPTKRRSPGHPPRPPQADRRPRPAWPRRFAWRPTPAAALALAGLLALGACKAADRAPEMAADEAAYSAARAPAAMGPGASGADRLAMAPQAAGSTGDADAAPAPGADDGAGTGLYIIKEASMSIQVDELERGLGRLEAVAAQGGGYIQAKQTDFGDFYHRRAAVTMAVKADQFEVTLERIRQLALSVIAESSSGVDVSQQVVDAEAEIANLEATRARIRGFLDKAEDVEEALQVNAQLTQIEGELAIRRGRLKDLGQRSSFSTIQVEVSEPLPQVSPTPWPTATPPPPATPGPPWDPGRQAGEAFQALRLLLQTLGSLAIWLSILGLPLLAILWLLRRLWLLVRPWIRRGGPKAPPPADSV